MGEQYDTILSHFSPAYISTQPLDFHENFQPAS